MRHLRSAADQLLDRRDDIAHGPEFGPDLVGIERDLDVEFLFEIENHLHRAERVNAQIVEPVSRLKIALLGSNPLGNDRDGIGCDILHRLVSASPIAAADQPSTFFRASADLRNAAIARRNSPAGQAGTPSHFSPAGTFDPTPLLAPIIAPSPTVR